MRKLTAAAVSAAIFTGSSLPAMAMEMPDMTGNTIVSEFRMESGEEFLSMTVSTELLAEDMISFSVSADAMLPDLAGNFTVKDVARIAGDSLYINVQGVMETLAAAMGESSITSLPLMIEINEPWVEIPALAIELPEVADPTDSIMTELAEAAAAFTFEETDNGMTIGFDGDTIVAVLTALENVMTLQQNQQMDMIQQILQLDYAAILDDYITAAAEGINLADSTVSVEEAKETILMAMDMVLQEAAASVTFSMDTPLEEVKQALADGVTVDGTIAIVEEGASVLVDVTGYDGAVRSIAGYVDETGFAFAAMEGDTEIGTLTGTVSESDESLVIDMVAVEGGESIPAKLTITPKENGGLAAFSITTDGETVEMILDCAVTESGVSLGLAANNGEETVKLSASFNMVEGVTVTDTTVPSATLLRDVVKTAVALIYSMNVTSE